MSDTQHGACFCGAIEIEVTGAPVEMGYCHCRSCRAYSGAPVAAFTLWRREQVRVIKGEALLARFNKTGFSERQHCARCGGHVMVDHPGIGFTDIPAGILPGLPFVPSVHLNYAEAVLPMRDGLSKLRDFSAEVGGSGERLPE